MMLGKRSRSGCCTCRKRHQKCDETKPACWNCRLRGVECGGYGIKLTEFTAHSGHDGQMVSKMVSGSPGKNPSGIRSRQRQRAKETMPRRANQIKEVLPRAEQAFRVGSGEPSGSSPVQFLHEQPSQPSSRPAPSNTHLASPDAIPEQQQLSRGNDETTSPRSSRPSTASTTHELMRIFSPGRELAGDDVDVDFSVGDRVGETWPGNSSSGQGDTVPASQALARSPWAQFDAYFAMPSFEIDTTPEPFAVASSSAALTAAAYDDEPATDEQQTMKDIEEAFMNYSEPVLSPRPNDPYDQYLFGHYMTNLSLRLYPANTVENPYHVVYGSMAAQSDAMHKMILFASAQHLVQLGQLPKFAIQPYRSAMRQSFRDALQNQAESWVLGVTVLLSIVFDVIGTGMDGWSSKLIGCRRLLTRGLSKAKGAMRTGLQCVLLQYNWDVMIGRALLRGLQPSASLLELKCIDKDEAPEPMKPFEDGEMAAHQSRWWNNLPDFRMHQIFREAIDLCSTVDELRAAPDRLDDLLRTMPQVAELVQKIETWTPDVSDVSREHADSVKHFNDVWRQGMLCYVYHDIYSLDSGDDRIQACVRASLEPLSRLSWLQAALFPIFMTAVHAQTTEARECFQTAFTSMHQSLAFQTPLSLALVLKNIWGQLDENQGGRVKWRDIVQDMGMELNILL
ncbi:hypothetical protein KVR01_007841 [Diaporthe batatas]|uniref:uncharacterized protein n=1 Tax=Diaporthe batatas TaxID=748121 RepID=UPI001D04A07A|nr:uncharacterized protein KVR01_007841 [Diaporthe batatas]KAG8162076.1 hypothetical protein KVR01_007841 [Diaporthe batatas]